MSKNALVSCTNKLTARRQLRRVAIICYEQIIFILFSFCYYGAADTSKFYCTDFCCNQKEVLIGTLLGDANLERKKLSHNARLRFDQTYPEQLTEYIDHLYSIFGNLTGPKGQPKVHVRKPDIQNWKNIFHFSF